MSKKRNRGRSGGSAWIFVLFAVLFISFSGQGYLFAWTCTGTTEQCQAYLIANNDASQPLTAAKIYDFMTPVVDENPNLIWKDDVVGSKVLVAAFKPLTSQGIVPFSDCQPGVPFPKDCSVSGSVWVTMVPEAYNFFKRTPFSILRFEQLLGLPPNSGNQFVVEYWADPKDLFRPASDPQIVYQEGAIQFPWVTNHMLSVNTGDSYKVWDDYCNYPTDPSCACPTGSQYVNYQCWFNNRKANVYRYDLSTAPYPWTGYGYTYDWGDSTTHVGLSEFVLNKAPIYNPFIVTIVSVSDAADYFKRNQRPRLALAKGGTGKGTVQSQPRAITCGPFCTTVSRTFLKYTEVTLTATPRTGSTFTGWTGACTGASATCNVLMNTNQSVTATFSAVP
jgi:uncharacterized repeat protein (TIGR02543 family)